MKKQTIIPLVVVVVVVVVLLVLYLVTRPQKEGFLGWDWRPWQRQRQHLPWYGSMYVPWLSGQQSYWQYPHSYVPWGPATGQSAVPPNACPQRVWDQYNERRRRYQDCLKCKPGCVVNTQSGQCGKCTFDQGRCEEQWGCPRSGGGYMPPVPPNLASCSVCQ